MALTLTTLLTMQILMKDHDIRRLASWAVLAACTLVACAPDPGDPFVPVHETERLRIGMSFEAELCQGHLDAWDAHAEAIEQALGVSREFAWLFLYDEDERRQLVADCGWEVGEGCWDGSVARATLPVVPHELVHAWTATAQRRPLRLLSEGLAVRMDGTVQRAGDEPLTVDDLFLAKVPGETYPRAGHFVAWLLATFGTESFMALYRRTSYGMSRVEVSQAFVEVLGQSPEQVFQRYAESAREYYPGMGAAACGQGPRIPWDGDVVMLPTEGSCADGPFFGFASTLWWQRVAIEVPTAGTYLFDPGGRSASITYCLTEPADQADLPVVKGEGVTADWAAFLPLNPNEYQEAWPAPLELEAGLYEVWIERSHETPGWAPEMSLRRL